MGSGTEPDTLAAVSRVLAEESAKHRIATTQGTTRGRRAGDPDPSQGGARPRQEQAVAERITRALVEVLAATSPQDLVSAAAEATDVDVLVHLLETAPLGSQSVPFGRLTTDERRRQLLAKRALLRDAGPFMTVAQVAELLGVGQEAVRARLRRGTLLGFQDSDGTYRIPSWQIVEGEVLPGLPRVLSQVPGSDPFVRFSALRTPRRALANPEGPRSLLEALLAGEVERARRVATHLHETGGA